MDYNEINWAYVQEHFDDGLTVEKISERVGIRTSHICKGAKEGKFVPRKGPKPKVKFDDIRWDEVQTEYDESELTLKQVGARLGISTHYITKGAAEGKIDTRAKTRHTPARKLYWERLTDTTEEFISKAINVHGVNYDYSAISYINTITHISVLCKTHNTYFSVTPKIILKDKVV